MGKILSRISEIANNEKKTISLLEREIGASKGVLSRAIKNGTDIQTKWLQLIVEKYPQYSLDWLIRGEGQMIAYDCDDNYLQSVNENSKPYQVRNKDEGVPYFDVDFIAGFDLIINDQTSIPFTNIVFTPFANASLWCNVSGESMSPKICNGDIIALKEQYIQDILYGEIYAVVMDNFRTIKILRKGSTPNKMRFIPINPQFDEQEFDKDRIQKVYAVLGTIKKFF